MRLTLTLFIAIIACAAWAQTFDWTEGGAPVVQGWNIEWKGQSAVTNDGGVVYVWSDTHTGERRVYAHKVMPDGSTPWDEPVAVSDLPGMQEIPAITALSDNSVVIGWTNKEDLPFVQVMAQKLNANGEAQWESIAAYASSRAVVSKEISLVDDGEGGARIVWFDEDDWALHANHINADGYSTFGSYGYMLASNVSAYYDCYYALCPDGSGGAVVVYMRNSEGSDKNIMAVRMNDTMWMHTVCAAVNDQNTPAIARTPEGDYIVVWRDRRNQNDGDIYAQRLSSEGQLMWAEDVAVCLAASVQETPKLIVNDAGEAIITWQDNRDDGYYSDVYAQKIDSAGARQWQDDGVCVVEESYHQLFPEIVDDQNGGAYIAWQDARNGGYPFEDIYCQHVLADGTFDWQAGGIAIADNDGEQHNQTIRWQGDNLLISWCDYDLLEDRYVPSSSPNTRRLRRQLLTPGGQELLPHNGDTVISGEIIRVGDITSVNSAGATYILYATYDDYAYTLRAQKVLPDGSTPWGPYGVIVQGNASFDDICAVPFHEGGIVFCYIKLINGAKRLYANVIDPVGNMLWGDEGVEVSSKDLNQDCPQLERWGDQYIVAWSQMVQDGWDYYYHLYAQKIVDGVICWGDEGVSLYPDYEGDVIVQDVLGNYISTHVYSECMVSRIEDNGSVSSGFENPMFFGTGYTGNRCDAVLQGDNLFLAWRQDDGDSYSIAGQMIAPDGQLVWGEDNVTLSMANWPCELRAVSGDDQCYLTWLDYGDNAMMLLAQAYDSTGQSLWGNTPTIVDSCESICDHVLIPTEYGALVFWSTANNNDYQCDLKIQHLSPDGDFAWDDGGAGVCSTNDNWCQMTTAVDDDGCVEAYWVDYRAADYHEMSAIYGQRIDIQYNPTDDEPVPAPVLNLAQNTPNPFNPETTISFTLAESGRAKLTVYNIRGQKVRTLADSEFSAGSHSLVWNGRDDNDAPVASGVYLYRLEAHDETRTRKMALLK